MANDDDDLIAELREAFKPVQAAEEEDIKKTTKASQEAVNKQWDKEEGKKRGK
jgi:hypothetical protein